jgi:hypothetical protein
MQFLVAVREGTLESLATVVKVAADQERAWWNEQLLQVDRAVLAVAQGPDHYGARRELMAQARALRARRRAAGELLGSRNRLVAHSAAQVLAQNGWDTDWPPIPVEAVSARGRRWGVAPNDPPFEERLPLDLPSAVGSQIKAAAYWVSAEPTRHLQEWFNRWGDGPIVTDREGGEIAAWGRFAHELGRALGHGPHREDFAERQGWRAQVLTSGDILRLAVDHALEASAFSAQ